MILNKMNRHIAITFLSIFTFVVMILVATMIPGLNGVQVAVGIALPLANPYLIISCLLAGAVAGKLRASLLMTLPASFCIGMVGGVMAYGQTEFSIFLMLVLLTTLLLWAVSLWLLKGTSYAGICLFFVGLAVVLGAGQPMPANIHGDMLFVLLGMLLSVLLLIACGVCTLIALTDVESILPEMGMPEINWKGLCSAAAMAATARNPRISW